MEDKETYSLFADVLLPMSRELFTYGVPKCLEKDIREGISVTVPFGMKKFRTGIVWSLRREAPQGTKIKAIVSPVTNIPVLDEPRRRFWEWLSDYYMCPLGDVMNAGVPASLKPEGATLEEKELGTFKPRMNRFIGLHPCVTNETELNLRFEQLSRARKQYDALIDIADKLGDGLFSGGLLPRRQAEADSVILNLLEKKQIIRIVERETTFAPGNSEDLVLPSLSDRQRQARDGIVSAFDTHGTVLLQGVPGSGKTEIYMHLAAGELSRGRNVLYLLPEIAVTSQLIGRFRDYFGDSMKVYHSGIDQRNNSITYVSLARQKEPCIILGIRSALFLPFPNLGLIIVDEEHDPSYKQKEPAPRYHARDAALMLARIHGARTLLGSATPSLESWYNARTGKYGYVRLDTRYHPGQSPRIIISDIRTAVKRGERRLHFNKLLLDSVGSTIGSGRQAILFQNRRGYSPFIQCGECGTTIDCPNCNVTLTYHKSAGKLKCHYCGHSKNKPEKCPGCDTEYRPAGFGTEKIEETISAIFPSARIIRLDRDTAASTAAFSRLVKRFEAGEADIMIGTQMVAKGFDFGGVTLVGVLNADNMLNFPDFRSSERGFQLLAQVSGRSGRGQDPGRVVIQTSDPDNPIFRQVADSDIDGFLTGLCSERQVFMYPPFCRIISIELRHRKQEVLHGAGAIFSKEGRTIFGKRLLGPTPPPVDRINREYILQFMLKIEKGKSFAEARLRVRGLTDKIKRIPEYRYLRVIYNVDPQ